MFNREILDVVIGLILIYLLYSLLVTAVQEAVSTILHRRANTLYDGVKSMLTNTSKDRGPIINLLIYLFYDLWIALWANLLIGVGEGKQDRFHDKVFNHPIIKDYGQNLLFKKPSYLSAENFAAILIETIKDLDSNKKNKTAFFSDIKNVVLDTRYDIDDETRQILIYHLNEAAGDLDVFKHRIEKWYNDTMDRVSGWYKRNTQFWLFVISLVIVIGVNLDSIEIANYLSHSEAARERLAQMGIAAAGNKAYDGADPIATEALDSIKASINNVNTLLGLGWGDYGRTDTTFKNRVLNDTESKIYKSYLKNLPAADSLFNVKCLQIERDTVKDRKARLLDSVETNRPAIVSQIQFGLLYQNDNYSACLARKYVCYRAWGNTRKIIGFILSAIAIGLGAPFWFDLLNKVVSLRTSVKTVKSSGSTTRNNSADNGNEIDG